MTTSASKNTPAHILPVIVIAQFAGTSLWFAGNAVLGDLQTAFQLPEQLMGYITSAVQAGFIIGTFVFALLLIADRYAAPTVFMWCAIAGAMANLSLFFFSQGLHSMLFLRFITGFFLAGIYPVGMKIAAEWFPKGLGLALGYLVGALVLGTAFPHLLSQFSLSWGVVLILTSVIATIGGIMMWWWVPTGPFRKKATRLDLTVVPKIFSNREFRSAAFGYFGHMWELYTFWAFVPFLLHQYAPDKDSFIASNQSIFSFLIITMGALGCIAGGYLSKKIR